MGIKNLHPNIPKGAKRDASISDFSGEVAGVDVLGWLPFLYGIIDRLHKTLAESVIETTQ